MSYFGLPNIVYLTKLNRNMLPYLSQVADRFWRRDHNMNELPTNVHEQLDHQDCGHITGLRVYTLAHVKKCNINLCTYRHCSNFTYLNLVCFKRGNKLVEHHQTTHLLLVIIPEIHKDKRVEFIQHCNTPLPAIMVSSH